MTKKEISFLALIVLAIVIFFILVTPTSSSSRKEAYKDYPTGWKKVKDNPKKKYDITGLLLDKQEVALRRQRLLEKRFNIRLHYRFLSKDARDRKLPLMMAAGNIPDFFMCPNKFIRKFSANGYLMQLPYEMMVKYCPHLVNLINKYQPNAWQCTMDLKGRNWGIPFLWAEGMYPKVGVWRVDWLHNVGLDRVPDNLTEMHEALYRFTYNDPDGNGIDDTYGMSGDNQYPTCTFTEIFGAYGSRPYCWIRKNGKPVWGGIQSEAKMALRTLRRWYKEGLIHPDFLTDGAFRQSKQKFANGKTGYLNYSCWYENFDKKSTSSLASMIANLQPGSEIAPGKPPLGPAKKRLQQTIGVVHYYSLVFGRHMTGNPAKVIRVLKMYDQLYADNQLFIEANIGIKGKHWDWSDKKVGHNSGAVLLEPYKSNQYIRDAIGLIQPQALLSEGDPEITMKYLPKAKIEFNKKYRNPKWGKPSMFYYLPQNEKYSHDLLFLQKKYYGEIIKGEMPLSAFETFKKLWLKQGGAVLTKEAQRMDKRMHRIFKKLGIHNNSNDKDASPLENLKNEAVKGGNASKRQQKINDDSQKKIKIKNSDKSEKSPVASTRNSDKNKIADTSEAKVEPAKTATGKAAKPTTNQLNKIKKLKAADTATKHQINLKTQDKIQS